MKIGFIGLGHMGTAMAANLLKAGHDVTVFNRSPGKSAALIEELGAHAAANIAAACEGEAVITMLADDGAAMGVTLGAEGIIAHLRRGAIHLSMSTIGINALSKALLAVAHAQAEPDAAWPHPCSGVRTWRQPPKLCVAAGDPAAVEACKPLFDALGQKTSTIGMEPSAANLVKLTANFLQASVIEALGEAIAHSSARPASDRIAYVNLPDIDDFYVAGLYHFWPPHRRRQFEPAAFAAPTRI